MGAAARRDGRERLPKAPHHHLRSKKAFFKGFFICR
jgi:hypothetical protein